MKGLNLLLVQVRVKILFEKETEYNKCKSKLLEEKVYLLNIENSKISQ